VEHVKLTGDHLWSGNTGLDLDSFKPLRDARTTRGIAAASWPRSRSVPRCVPSCPF